MNINGNASIDYYNNYDIANIDTCNYFKLGLYYNKTKQKVGLLINMRDFNTKISAILEPNQKVYKT